MSSDKTEGTRNQESSAATSRDPFARMRIAQLRAERCREQLRHNTRETIAVSGQDVRWLCDCVLRVLAVMQDGETTYATIDTDENPPKILTPMMVERDALAEALREEGSL